MLLHQAIGDQLTCIFVNNGLLRENEAEAVRKAFRRQLPHQAQDGGCRRSGFLKKLAGVTDPEQKRKIIGNEFVRVFERSRRGVAASDGDGGEHKFLAQGTLYPDVIESVSISGNPAALIKSHHNVGGLPEDMKFELIEPLRQLFKDEVRQVGHAAWACRRRSSTGSRSPGRAWRCAFWAR